MTLCICGTIKNTVMGCPACDPIQPAGHDTWESWREALELARERNTDWRVEINSPPYIDYWKCPEGRYGYRDRWGVFHCATQHK